MPFRSALTAVLLLVACGRGDSSKGDVTIYVGPNGATVDGAPLKGDPKVCAAFKRCCASSELSLFCGMAQAANDGDCTKSLKDAKAYASEAGVRTPPGCN
jgi:hypothetical protein